MIDLNREKFAFRNGETVDVGPDVGRLSEATRNVSGVPFHSSLISSGDTATCLYNAPHEDEALPRVLPGKLLSLDAQCRKDRGTSACFVSFTPVTRHGHVSCSRIRDRPHIRRICHCRKTIEFALSCSASTLDPDTAWHIVQQRKARLAGTVRYERERKRR